MKAATTAVVAAIMAITGVNGTTSRSFSQEAVVAEKEGITEVEMVVAKGEITVMAEVII